MISPFMFWNIRGVCTSQVRLRKLIQQFCPNIIALAEPFLLEDKILSFLRRFSCESFLNNEAHGGKIWLMQNSNVSVHWLAGTNQFISVKVEDNGTVYVLTIVYAKCNQFERKTLWEDLEANGHGNFPWVVCGEFNIIKVDTE